VKQERHDRHLRRRGPDLPSGVRRRQRQRRRARARHRRVAFVLIALACLLLITGVGATGFGSVAEFRSDCSLSTLRPVRIGQNSFVYAANGSLLGAIPADKNRQPVQLRNVDPWVRKATVAIEDRRFYQHGGVDYEGIARAALKDIQAGHLVEGGSTITQQLVRNLYIGRERTFKRKIKEACLAIKLSRAWSKNRILGTYLNQVYYGNHAYGIEAAAQTYFSRHAGSLTLAQSALLAGLPQAPTAFDPFHHATQALNRRNEVLHALFVNGDITALQYRTVRRQRKLHLKPGRLYTKIREPFFFSFVRDQLISEYGANTVRTGGLRVYTTIDPRLQLAAVHAIRDTLDERSDPSAAIVSIDPHSGAIRAMTAVTPGHSRSQFNIVAQARRQPGSTFKTMVLATAVAEGMDPNSTYYVSAPFHYQPDPYTPCPRGCWDVTTYDNSYLGDTSVTNATLHSDNTVYAQMTLDLGPENVAAMAHKLGVRTPLTTSDGAYVPSMGLGSIAVSPLDMASAYATLAAGGIYSKPMAIRKVVLSSGKVDTDAGWGKPQQTRVIPDWVASTVTSVLEQNMLHGTGTGAYFGRPAGGKTGTTDDYADAWFCGYTPTLEATVWIGYASGEVPMTNVHGTYVSGPGFPATIWKSFMESAVGSTPYVDFAPPREAPEFTPFKHGQYALQYVPNTNPVGTSTGTTGSTSSSTTSTGSTTHPPAATTAPVQSTSVPAPTIATPTTPTESLPAIPEPPETTPTTPPPTETVPTVTNR
jgi:penicillin-binding protein 1A